jgi:hypothetical protein
VRVRKIQNKILHASEWKLQNLSALSIGKYINNKGSHTLLGIPSLQSNLATFNKDIDALSSTSDMN